MTDPMKQRQRLTASYAQMGEEELLALRDDFANLTETAQQILREELRRRNLPTPPDATLNSPRLDPYLKMARLRALSAADEVETPSAPEYGPFDYTWKVGLRTFASAEEAWMAHEVLKEAGIENWLEVPRDAFDPTEPRVRVAADEVEKAIEVLKRPIPDVLREAAVTGAEDFVPPHCPGCGDPDPLLESVEEETNRWHCESCGRHWSE